MATSHAPRRPPELVRVVLRHLARMWAERSMSKQELECKINRLRSEDLEPCNFELTIRELNSGKIRFIVKDKSSGGETCELIE